MQVVDALPDEEFSTTQRQPHQLVSSISEAIKLPARLKVKWLRADCLSVLDLCALEVPLTLPTWISLVMCICVVPNLKLLALKLPRGEVLQQGLYNANGTLLATQYLTDTLCQYCDNAAFNQMRQATIQGGPDYPFTVDIPIGVTATCGNNPTCTRCQCDSPSPEYAKYVHLLQASFHSPSLRSSCKRVYTIVWHMNSILRDMPANLPGDYY